MGIFVKHNVKPKIIQTTHRATKVSGAVRHVQYKIFSSICFFCSREDYYGEAAIVSKNDSKYPCATPVEV